MIKSKGKLTSKISSNNLVCLQSLVVHGEIDARDIAVIRDSMFNLINLDLSDTKIQSYEGDKGTVNQYYTYQSTAVYNNTTGLIYWDIIQGANAVLTITELEYFTKSILVPSMATSELSDL